MISWTEPVGFLLADDSWQTSFQSQYWVSSHSGDDESEFCLWDIFYNCCLWMWEQMQPAYLKEKGNANQM